MALLESENRSLAKNAPINGLRAFLAGGVMAYHFGWSYFVNFQGYKIVDPQKSLVLAIVGVFYALSGFFLSFRSPGKFAYDKLFRLIIPFIGVSLMTFLICYYGGFPKYLSWAQLGYNLLIYPPFLGNANYGGMSIPYAAGNLWFVAGLIHFMAVYFVFNLLGLLSKKVNIVPWLMLVMITVCFSVYLFRGAIPKSQAWVSHIFHYDWLYFAFGYYLRLFYDAALSKKTGSMIVTSLLLVVSFVFLFLRVFAYGQTHIGGILLFVLLIAVVILCLGGYLNFLSWKPLQVLGDSSLAIYMIHEYPGELIIHSLSSVNYYLGVALAVLYAVGGGIALHYGYRWLTKHLKKNASAAPNEPAKA